jgi:hypothetical protein
MAESLRAQHPDVVTTITRWGRPQHFVNYAPFKRTPLRRRAGVVIPAGPNEYGMKLLDGEWVES